MKFSSSLTAAMLLAAAFASEAQLETQSESAQGYSGTGGSAVAPYLKSFNAYEPLNGVSLRRSP